MSVTARLTKIRISTLKETRNKFGYSSVWTADGKIMYKEEGDTKAKVYFDWYSGKQKFCYEKKQYLFLILMASFYFYLFGGFFTKHFKTVSYFVFLTLFRSILPLIKIILIKIQFVYFISLSITIQKQPPRGVLKKRCSEIMQQIYRRTPMPKWPYSLSVSDD